MISSIAELCDKALEYILSVPAQNRDYDYTPKGSLKKDTVLKTYTFDIFCGGSTNRKSTMYIKTNEVIPARYTNRASDEKITND